MPINSLLYPANSAVSGGYDVDNSCRFDSASSADLRISDYSGAGTSRRTRTYSMWIKRSELSYAVIFGSSGKDHWVFTAGNKIQINIGSGTDSRRITDMVFRDVSAWYHIVFAYDTTQGTASNRFTMWVNGAVATTSIVSGKNEVAQNEDANVFINNDTSTIASDEDSASYFDGYMAEWVFVDGQKLDADSFGEYDSDSGIWKPIDVSGITLGTNGFYLNFQTASDLGIDAGNDNDFEPTNLTAINQTTDTCTNNFALANPLNVNASNVGTFAFGNTTVKVANSSGFSFGSSSTIGVSSGKWYCEAKIITVDATLVGVSANVAEDARDNYPPGTQGGAQSVGILVSSGNKYIDDSGTTHGAALSANDILMIALDLDNNNVYFGKNGQWFDGSGNADESNPNSAIAVTAVGSTAEGAYFFSFGDGGGSSKGKVSWNFGNASHAISSGNTDGDGFGNFEYAVPSGYFALCTKNLAEYG